MTLQIANLKKNDQKLYKKQFLLDLETWKFFDVFYKNFKNEKEMSRVLWVKTSDITNDLINKKIPSYKWFVYQEKNIEWYYNLFDKNTLCEVWEKPFLHPEIEFLLNNLCNWWKREIEWLLKAIAFKYTHIDDFLMPAVVFRWEGGSWKWLFISLLSSIFWEENCETWLKQDNIESKFSTLDGTKLVVEYRELVSDNIQKGRANMNRLKSMIMEENIQMEKKWMDTKQVKNKAWFVMSSNNPKPLQLDSDSSWNRRFTIIKTWSSIDEYRWPQIRKAIDDKENIKWFLAYIFDKYPEMKNEKRILALDNEEKRRLVEMCEPVWQRFFRDFEETYPYIYKISMDEFKYFLDTYRVKVWEDDYRDTRYDTTNFMSWLSDRYEKKKQIKIRWKNKTWFLIHKTPTEMSEIKWPWYFDNDITEINKRELNLKLKK